MSTVFAADLQETSGTSIAGTNTGTKAGGSVVATTGPGGLWPSAITFDGVDDQIAFSTIAASGTSYTYMIWLRMSGNQPQFYSPFFSRGSSTNVCGLSFPSLGSLVGYTHGDASATYNYAGGPTIPHNQWVVVAAAIASGNTKLYCISSGGTSVSTHSQSLSSSNYIQSPVVGADSFGGRRFTGALAGARIDNTQLSQADIEAYYALGIPSVSGAVFRNSNQLVRAN